MNINNLKNNILLFVKNKFKLNNYIKELLIYLENSNFEKIKWKSFITLTYENNEDYKKKNLDELKIFFEKKDCKYFWVIEYGKKDNVHIHLIIDKYIEQNELKLKWQEILKKKENVIIDIRKIIDIEKLHYYLFKDLNDKKINYLKKLLNLNKLNIWGTNLEYKRKIKDLTLYEKELEDLVLFETFLEYKDNEKYSWIFLISNKIAINIIKTIKKNKEKIEKFNKLINNPILFESLTKSFILFLFSLGIKKEFNFVNFINLLSKTFLKLYPELQLTFGNRLRNLNINNFKNEIRFINEENLIINENFLYDNNFNQENLKLFLIGNGLLTLYKEELSKYIILDTSKIIFNKNDYLPQGMIILEYTEEFKNFIKKKDCQKNLNQLITGIIGYKFLMVVKPKNWELKNNKIIEYGGYLYNKMPLIITEGHNHIIKLSSFVINNLNYLQCQGLKLNKNLIKYLIENSNLILNCLSLGEDLESKFDIIKKKIKECWNNIYNKLINKDALNDYFKTVEGLKDQQLISELNGELDLIREKLSDIYNYKKLFGLDLNIKNNGFLNKYDDIETVYIPYNLDFRGRVYPLNTDLNFHASKLSRSLFLSENLSVFNLNTFIIYIVRCYYKKKYNDQESINLFYEKLNKIVINFRKENYYEDISKAQNLYAFLSCCIEYEQYLLWQKLNNKEKIIENNIYKSNFIISLDATCSGSQILSLLVKENSFFEALNLKNNNEIGDFYLFYINEFKKSKFYTSDIEILWNQSLFGKLSDSELRLFFKNIIMTFNYGLTFIGFLEKFRENFNKFSKLKNIIIDNDICKKLSKTFWEFSRGLRFMILSVFFNKLVLLYNKLGLNIEWITPLNNKITQKYLKEKIIKLDIRLNFLRKKKNSKSEKLSINDFIKTINIKVKNFNEIDVLKGSRALTANYIHSMDSSLLFFVVNEFNNANKFIACVHDCFFINTCDVDFVLDSYKKALIDLFLKSNILDEFLISINNDLELILKKDDLKKDLKNRITEVLSLLNQIKIDVTYEEITKLIEDVRLSKYSLVISS